MSRRKQHVPWRAAGATSERQHSADDVVRTTGWVFNNRTGDHLDLKSFVESGDAEVGAYLTAFGVHLLPREGEVRSLVEIGAGIGRMTAAFTRLFHRVIACDLDAAFLERCRETVAQRGRPEHLYTVHVGNGRSLDIDDGVADITFSYITLQHCQHDDALSLTSEAVRITKPGGLVLLNYRTWTAIDAALWPAGKVMRAMWRLPRVGPILARQRASTRLGWQANRLAPDEVLQLVAPSLDDIRLFRSPGRRPFDIAGTTDATFEGVHRSHWWLVATVRGAEQ